MSHLPPDIWRPPWGQVHRRPETCSGWEPFFPRERSQPAVPDGVCPDALQGVTNICAASSLADLLDKTLISDELASDVGTDHLVNRLG